MRHAKVWNPQYPAARFNLDNLNRRASELEVHRGATKSMVNAFDNA
jgi:hypothetical protein